MVYWNSTLDALLFKHVLKLHEIKPKYDELEKAMRADGVDATAKAITHRIGKIRSTVNPDNQDSALGPPTPKSRGAAGSAEKSRKRKANEEPKQVMPDGSAEKSRKRKANEEPKQVMSDGSDHFDSAEASQEQEAGSEAADEGSPKKKQKRAAPKKAGKVKKEIVKDEEDDAEYGPM